SDIPICRTEVLRPRCWSGRNSTFASRCWSNAHSSATCALDDVQTAPPCLPQKALMSAEEFMYVTGTTDGATPASSRASHASSTRARAHTSRLLDAHDTCGKANL